MRWIVSHRADPESREIADRHYNRQKVGHVQFVPPGRCLVLKYFGEKGNALWITSWPYTKYVRHAWAGAWVCSCFRNESGETSSLLINEAVAATRSYFGTPPTLGMVTFINTKKVKPIMRRGEPHWGYCYEKAGFQHVGYTKQSKLKSFLLFPDLMPDPEPPIGFEGPHEDAK